MVAVAINSVLHTFFWPHGDPCKAFFRSDGGQNFRGNIYMGTHMYSHNQIGIYMKLLREFILVM